MSSAAKTLELLNHFSGHRPEIGLSQMCKLAKRDKATTYRHLQALEDAGFVEQNPLTKGYRIGPSVLQLARLREETVPRKQGAQGPTAALAQATGETAHASTLGGDALYTLLWSESTDHSTRVIMDVATLPLHATASGLCALAFGPARLMDVATAKLDVFTANTITTPDALAIATEEARKTGIALSNRSFEDEVHSFAAPLFDQTGHFAGAVSVACVATRLTPELERRVRENLMIASRTITRNWGGSIPDAIEAAWTASLSQSTNLEHTS